MEASQVSINEWINDSYGQAMGYSALKRKETLDTCYNKNEPWGLYVKWNKPLSKKSQIFDSTFMNCQE